MEFIQMHKLVKARTYFFYLKLVNYLLSISPNLNINNLSIQDPFGDKGNGISTVDFQWFLIT